MRVVSECEGRDIDRYHVPPADGGRRIAKLLMFEIHTVVSFEGEPMCSLVSSTEILSFLVLLPVGDGVGVRSRPSSRRRIGLGTERVGRRVVFVGIERQDTQIMSRKRTTATVKEIMVGNRKARNKVGNFHFH